MKQLPLRELFGAEVLFNAQFGLLSVVHREAFQQQRTKARARATAHGVIHKKALQTRAVVRKLADAVKAQVHDLLADRVVAASVVVRRILLAGDQLLGVEKLAVRPRADLVHHRRLQVEEHRARHVLASAGLREERVERVVLHTNRLVGRHRTVGLDTVLQTEQLPARIANLATGLTDVNANRLTHLEKKEFI
ncbi:hypothetical protein TcYC6_0033930 [Trypanosoma cruzi]|nr:hypothetical protein TcYC6_0033930 [Trypanosoma cruzi]